MHESLLQISKEDRRSLSSTIAIILSDYLNKRKISTYETKQEKRQYPREVLSVPAVIMQPDTQQEGIADITENFSGRFENNASKGYERPVED